MRTTKKATCEYCGTEFAIDDEIKKVEIVDAEKLGYEMEKGKQKAQNEVKKKSKGREAVEFLLPIVLAFVIAMVLKTCVFANAKVPSGSMLNTIYEQDRIIASRLEYKFHEPERGDIVIFKSPDDLAKGNTVYFIKRVIGLPGETVTIVNGVVYITDKDGNSEQLKEDYVTVEPPEGNYGPYVVPEDSYFVMGDNRNDSVDSRFWTTTHFVQKDLIIGKAKFCYYPFDQAGKFE
jgi:signal peptidase I